VNYRDTMYLQMMALVGRTKHIIYTFDENLKVQVKLTNYNNTSVFG
jgi:hypothetical protein